VKNILVLEDEAPLMEIFRAVLNEEYTVFEASTARLAILEHRRHHIDLLIADLSLPVSSGILVALQLHSLSPDLRTILTSGYPLGMWDKEHIAKLKHLPLGSVNILQKPFFPATLLAKVHGLIGDSSSQLVATS